jgi:hypothetical protein
MIESIDSKWKKYTTINNQNFEIIDHGIGKTVVFKDFLKYPDKFKSLLESFPYFENNDNGFVPRPGKSFGFYWTSQQVLSNFIGSSIASIFNDPEIEFQCTDFYVNCFNGDMKANHINPHFDIVPSDFNFTQPTMPTCIVSNLGLTKNMKGGTGFWSFKGKTCLYDIGQEDGEEFMKFISEIKCNGNWEQITNIGDLKLEYIVPMDYNSLVVYSPAVLHNPYIENDWFLSEDRLSLASFYKITDMLLQKLKFNQSTDKNLFDGLHLDKLYEIVKYKNEYQHYISNIINANVNESQQVNSVES